MLGNFARSGWKQILICFLSLFSIGNTSIYAFERGPITRAGGDLIYKADPQSACDYLINTYRGTPYFPVPGSNDADLLSIWPTNWPTSGPASSYRCNARVYRFAPFNTIMDISGAAWVYPVCKIRDPVSTITSATICNIPDNIPDPGVNSGQPQFQSCIGNPVNAATGNKYAEEVDIASPTINLAFSRYYNSNNFSGSAQIGTAWRHTFLRSLFVNAETITATRSDGRLVYFRLINSVWVNQQMGSDALVQLTDSSGNLTSWRFIDADDIIETYDTSGKLLSITNRGGRTQTPNYDTNGRLITVTDDTGRALNFTYDGANRIATLTDPAGEVIQYDYDDSNGNLTSVTYPDGKTRTYHYNEPIYTSNTNLPHALTGVTDENGVRYATYTYDVQGRAIITEHAGGADRYALSYSSNDSSTIVTDPLGSQYTHQFQAILGVAKSIGQSQPAGSGCNAASSAITYDSNGNVASRTDFNGNKSCYTFDLTRNQEIARIEGLSAGSACPDDLISHTPAADSSERKILTDWHASFRLPVRITEAKRETSFSYDAHGNITLFQIKDTATGASRSWTTSYVHHPAVPGVIVRRIEDGPRTDVADVTTIDNYAPDATCIGSHFGCRGQIATVTNALGHVTQMTRYNAHGQLEEIIDPNGLVTTLTYDTRQRLLIRASGTEITRYRYDDVGQLIQLIRPDNSTLTYTYDDAHRLIKITDRLGNTIRFTLDAVGNHVREEIFDASNALVKTRQQEFDALSRLAKMIGAQNQTIQFGYDPNGNLTQTTNALQHTTSHRFDALNRLIQSIDPVGGQIRQNHDALNKVTKVTDPKGIDTTYVTNALGDILQEISSDRGSITYTYDAAGNQITRTDARGVVQTTVYDALDRPISQSYTTVADVPDTAPITWRYDEGTNGIGHLTGMSDESGTTMYQYDPHGRTLSKTQTVHFGKESYTHALTYQYDSSGRLSRTVYPSGAIINTFYGADGRPVEIRVNGNILLQDIVYHPFGLPKSWVLGNRQPYDRSYDLDGRLTQHPLGADTQTLHYDAANRMIGTNQSNSIYNRSYEYDALDRLIRQADHTSMRLWDYDANSNRISEQSGSMVYPYALDSSNRLLQVAGPVAKTYTYDAAGNPLADGVIHYAWNAAGRLSKMMAGNKVSGNLYNGLGEHLLKAGSRSTRGGPYLYFYDPTGQLIGDYEKTKGAKQATNWIPKQETIWLGDIPVAVIKRPTTSESAQVYYIHTDHLNTPRLIMNQNNTPVWRWDNVHAFGSNLPDEDPDGDGQSFEYNLRFPGQYFDKETDLHYNYFRYYEPETGRYLTPDPIGLAGGINVYGYVVQNPLKWSDPLGLDAQITVWQPVGWGSSSFGHASISINGTTWSWGPNGMTKISQDNYNSRNSFRSGVTSNIPLTPTQDAKLARFLDNYGGNYNPITNNCTAPVQQGLLNVGVNIGNNILPVSVGNAILNTGIANRFTFNPSLQPAIGSSAPWAK